MNDPAPFDIIRLNGQTFSQVEIVEHSKEKLADPLLGEWEQELYRFYLAWFDTDSTASGLFRIQSSGSTGKPKELIFTKKQMIGSALRTGRYFHLEQMNNCLLCLPVKYIAGKMMVVRAMQFGLDLLTVKPTINPLGKICCSIDFAAMTPQQVYNSLIEGNNLNCIKTLIIGGGEVTQALSDMLQPLNTKCYATYGMTETLTHIALQKLNGDNKQSSFECLRDVEIAIDDRSCLLINAPFLSPTVVTNDIVEIVDNKKFRWMGRIDNVVNSGGVKIYPEQIEKQIEQLVTGIFFVASRPDVVLGEKLLLVLENEEISEERKMELIDMMKKHLPAYHYPQEIICIPTFNYTETGKINRKMTLGNLSHPNPENKLKLF